jgi:CheY-like chemotaxis protein
MGPDDKGQQANLTTEEKADAADIQAVIRVVDVIAASEAAEEGQGGPNTPTAIAADIQLLRAETAERTRGTMTPEMEDLLKEVDLVCVDDEKTIREPVEGFAKRFGAKSVKTFNCGEDFLAALDTIPQGASVILDNTMKREKGGYWLEGIKIAEKAREAGRTDLRIYIFSGDFSGQSGDPFKFKMDDLIRRNIINGFFAKPGLIKDMLKKIALKAKT